jgi:hypothetical protein
MRTNPIKKKVNEKKCSCLEKARLILRTYDSIYLCLFFLL